MNGKSGVSNRQIGFTLLEMMVALSIFAVISVGAYQLIRGALASHEQSKERVESFSQLSSFLRLLERDLKQAIDRPVREGYGDRTESFVGEFEQLEFTHAGWSNPFGDVRSTLQRTSYQIGYLSPRLSADVAQQRKQTLYWVRYHWEVLDRAQHSEPVISHQLPVKDIQIRYLSHTKTWHGSWPVVGGVDDDSGVLPLAIEVVLNTQEFGEIRRVFQVGDPSDEEAKQ